MRAKCPSIAPVGQRSARVAPDGYCPVPLRVPHPPLATCPFYPFIPDSVNPRTIQRWVSRKTSRIGMTTRTDAAIVS